MTPKRIQRKRTKGWRIPEGAVYVGRPTIWGNPFVHRDSNVAARAYRKLISDGTKSFEMGPGKLQYAHNAHPNTLHYAYAEFVRLHAHELRGKDLVCWCKDCEACHADVLLEIANG
jgi:hypothetical protein